MSFKTIMFVVLGLVLSTSGTLLLMRGDMRRMQTEQHAHNLAEACRQQAADAARSNQDTSGGPVGALGQSAVATTPAAAPAIDCPASTPAAAVSAPQAASSAPQSQGQVQTQSQGLDQPQTTDQGQTGAEPQSVAPSNDDDGAPKPYGAL